MWHNFTSLHGQAKRSQNAQTSLILYRIKDHVLGSLQGSACGLQPQVIVAIFTSCETTCRTGAMSQEALEYCVLFIYHVARSFSLPTKIAHYQQELSVADRIWSGRFQMCCDEQIVTGVGKEKGIRATEPYWADQERAAHIFSFSSCNHVVVESHTTCSIYLLAHLSL